MVTWHHTVLMPYNLDHTILGINMLLGWRLLPALLTLTAVTMEVGGSALGTFTANTGTVCSGQDITYTCTLHHVSENSNSSDLVIVNNNIKVDSDHIQIRDNRSVVYTLYNVSPESHSLECCVGPCGDDRSNMVGDGPVLLRAEEAPRPVENIKCVAYGYDIWMKCTVEQGEDYTKAPYNASINLQMKFKLDLYDVWANCTRTSTDNIQFTCNSIDFYQMASLIDVRVAIKPECGLVVYSQFSLADIKCIKPKQPELKVMLTDNATCVHVNITSKTFTARRKNYRLSYRHLGEHDTPGNIIQTLFINDTADDTTHLVKALSVCGLVPFQKYTFSLEVSAQDGQCCCWSDSHRVTLRLPSAAPSASPTMLPGMFTWKRSDCQNRAVRMVHVYTQPIEEQFWLGKKMALVFTYRSGEDEGKMEEPPNVTYTSLPLQCDRAYGVGVQVQNDIGLSPDDSYISIPAANKVIDPPAFMVEHTETDGVVMFEWVDMLPANVTRYTVYWCRHDGGDNCDPNSTVHWLNVESVDVLSVRIDVGRHVLIGASIETAGYSSGLRWESCIYAQNGVPRKPELNVEVGSDDSSLYVTWEKLLCKTEQPYISHYVVTYCAINSQEHCLDTVVPYSKNYLMLTNLDADLKYSVRVRGVARNGTHGVFSDQVIKQPTIKGLTTEEIGWTVSGSVLFGLVLIVAVIYETIRLCRRKYRSPEIDDVKIDKPSNHTEHQVPSLEDGENTDGDENDEENESNDDNPDGGTTPTFDLNFNTRTIDVKKFHRKQRKDSGISESSSEDEMTVLQDNYNQTHRQPLEQALFNMHATEPGFPSSEYVRNTNIEINVHNQGTLKDTAPNLTVNNRSIAGYDDPDAQGGSVDRPRGPDDVNSDPIVSYSVAVPEHVTVSFNGEETETIGQSHNQQKNSECIACKKASDGKGSTLLEFSYVKGETILTNGIYTTDIADVVETNPNVGMIPKTIDNEMHSTTCVTIKNTDSSYDIDSLQEQDTHITETRCLLEKQALVPPFTASPDTDAENVYVPLLDNHQEQQENDSLFNVTIGLMQLDTSEYCTDQFSEGEMHDLSLRQGDETHVAMGDNAILSKCNQTDGGYITHDTLQHPVCQSRSSTGFANTNYGYIPPIY